MNEVSRSSVLTALIAAGVMAVPSIAGASAVLRNPADTVALGLNDNGSLNVTTGSITDNASATGIAFKFTDGTWQDATAPGCYCEGWGISVNGTVSGHANVEINGTAGTNLTFGALTGVTGSTAISTVSLTSLPGLTVTHQVLPATAAPGALFRMHVTITNGTSSDVANVKYVRVMDWDVPPTEFDELVTIRGVATTSLLEESHDDGFHTSDPLAASSSDYLPGTLNVDFADVGPEDHGAYFRFNLGTIAAGASRSFDIYYGATSSEASALSAIGAEGIELYSLGQSDGNVGGTPATYIFGFKGVGGVPILPGVTGPVDVPTLSQWALILLSGLVAGMAWISGRSRRVRI